MLTNNQKLVTFPSVIILQEIRQDVSLLVITKAVFGKKKFKYPSKYYIYTTEYVNDNQIQLTCQSLNLTPCQAKGKYSTARLDSWNAFCKVAEH